MSFTDEVKHELVRYDSDNEKELEAELTALMRRAGSIILSANRLAFRLEISYADLSRRVYSWLRSRYDLAVEVLAQDDRFGGGNNYEIYLPDQPELNSFLKKLKLLTEEGRPDFYINPRFFTHKKQAQAYIRGFFLAAGSVNRPEAEYHLEIRCDHSAQAEDLMKLFFTLNLRPGFIEHRDLFVLYFKNFESISAVLNLMGAEKAQLKLENNRIVSGMKEDVNRRVNFETANLDKTVSAAMEQLQAIKDMERAGKLQDLPSGLQEMAELRKNNPYASLKELGEKLDPPLSKSGVNSRMRRLKKIARGLRGEQ
ncbi:DNA-binding protein WhiA [Halarsenatibacter silvermanii]|uniref:Probable cell division protein WhiA n=1 Tax=Halarsenatibacter silvermanii TaxID=321763 RepID=A0A1G9RQA0_9FIRM|nr:DNA-binding protein WhiA [Halarsenatibacter silvermanii]SDM25342.1 hypothetical protein SAMN04488692_12323 [Halarsenatibacter silvermanii]